MLKANTVADQKEAGWRFCQLGSSQWESKAEAKVTYQPGMHGADTGEAVWPGSRANDHDGDSRPESRAAGETSRPGGRDVDEGGRHGDRCSIHWRLIRWHWWLTSQPEISIADQKCQSAKEHTT